MKPRGRKQVGSGWSIGAPKLVFHTRIFDLCSHEVHYAPGNYHLEHYFLRCVDWVNILPITADRKAILVEQYRPTVGKACLEIPGGMLDASTEDPLEAAGRELLEETGFVSKDIRSLGWVYPNPATHTNKCHFYVAYNCEDTEKLELDPGEDLRVIQVPVADLPAMVREGRFEHALTQNALIQFFLLEGTVLAPG